LRLLDATRDKQLHFNVLGLVALQRNGTLDQEKLKSLIKVFRPGRDGHLGLVDFVKSVVSSCLAAVCSPVPTEAC
jgi:Ca2+-binding EF-hand superfamily protein